MSKRFLCENLFVNLYILYLNSRKNSAFFKRKKNALFFICIKKTVQWVIGTVTY